MPFLVAAIPAALMSAGMVGITGATVLGFTGMTAALIAGGATLALGSVQNLLSGKKSSSIGDIGPSRSPFTAIPDQPRTWCYGRGATGGTIKYWYVGGGGAGMGNGQLYMVVAVHDTEVDAFEAMYINNELVTFSGNAAQGKYKPGATSLMFRYDHLGSENQLADSVLVAAAGGEWTSNHRLRGMAYYVWAMTYDKDVYASGIPTPLLVLRGRKVWDPREDPAYGGTGSQDRSDPSTWTWSQNPSLCLLDYLLGIEMAGVRIGGCGVPIGRLDIDSFINAANVSDEQVDLAGGGTENRYTCNGFVTATEDKASVVQSLLQTMCGLLVYRTGTISVIPGAAQTSVMSLSDDDLAAPITVNPTTSRQEKANSITSIYAEPEQLFQVVSAPPLVVPAYQVIDGGILLESEVQHRLTTSVATVQRLNKLILGNFREQLSIDAIWKPRAAMIAIGQTFNWTSSAAGYVNQKMICLDRELQENGSVRIVARQETDAKYSWATSDQEPAPSFETSTVGDIAAVIAPLSGDVAVSGVNLIGRDSSSVPALLLTCAEPPVPFVLSIITVYRLSGDTNWHSGPTIEPVRPPGPAYITGISPGADYDVGFAYVTAFGVSAYTVKSTITSGSNLISTGATAGSIDTAALDDGAVTAAKFAAGLTPVEIVSSLPVTGNYTGRTVVLTTDGKLYRYYAGAFTAAVPTVDLSGQITNGQLATGVIDRTKVANGLQFVQIVASLPGSATQGDVVFLTADNKLYRYTGGAWTKATDGADITASTITAGAIAAGAIGTTQLAAGSVTAGKIGAGEITAAQIAAGTITANELAANSITSAKIQANAVVAGAIAAGAINAGTMIVNDLIVTGHLVANAATNGTVSVSFGTSLSSSFATLNSQSKTLVGGPVLMTITDYVDWSSAGPVLDYQILRDGAQVMQISVGGGTCPDKIPVSGQLLDIGATAGAHTYTLQAKHIGGSSVVSNAAVMTLTELKR